MTDPFAQKITHKNYKKILKRKQIFLVDLYVKDLMRIIKENKRIKNLEEAIWALDKRFREMSGGIFDLGNIDTKFVSMSGSGLLKAKLTKEHYYPRKNASTQLFNDVKNGLILTKKQIIDHILRNMHTHSVTSTENTLLGFIQNHERTKHLSPEEQYEIAGIHLVVWHRLNSKEGKIAKKAYDERIKKFGHPPKYTKEDAIRMIDEYFEKLNLTEKRIFEPTEVHQIAR